MKRRRETTEIVLISTLILMVTLSPLLGVISPRSAMASDEAPWSEIEPEDAELPDEDELEVDARSEPDEPSDAQVDRGPGPPGHANDQAPWSEIESDEPDDFPRSERPPTQPTVEPPAPPWVNIKRPIRPVPSPPGHGRGRPHFEQSDTFQFSSDEETSTVQVQGSSIQSDDFNSTSLNTDLWQFVDPVGDSSYEMRGTNVRVIVPGGTSHDIWSSGNNAPRLVQPAANTDFEVEAKFNTMPSGNNAMQGILVEADAQNFIRFDVYSNSNGLNVFASTFANSSPSIRVNAGITKGAPLYLRVRRIGNQWTYLYSYNGNDWTTAASFTFNLNVSKVGFYAGNSTSNPAFFGTVDYFFNTASPIDPVNPDGSVDTFSPIIHNVTYTPTHDSIAVEWYTDEAATGAVEYGTTGDFELGSVSQEQDLYRHSVVVSGLSQVTNYHLRVTSTDIHGNTSTGSSEVVRTDPSPTSGPYVDVWYGDHQRFGHNGNPQWWVNIHGRVISAHQVTSLSYRLNGGAASSLSIGPDSRRLVNPGDFIIEINYEHLNDGLNSVVISSTDSEGFQSEKTVTIEYDAGNVWPLPYAVDWSTAGEINDVAQVVDGHWAIQGDGVRTLDPGYDRLLAIGDLAWTDYEVEVPITIHSFGAANNGPGVGIVVRWPGHYDWDGSQPRHGWHPLGAIGWYRNNMLQPGHTKLNIYGSGDRILAEDNSGRQLELETPYMFKMRVESRPGQSSLYQVKVWQQGTPEPGEWDLVSGGYPGELTYGSLLLLAHHADATFGSVQVTPLSDEPPPDPDDPTDPQPTDIVSDHFSSTTLNTDVWQYIDPVGDSALTLTGSHAQIGVPAGSAHDVWTGGNQAPRLMQAANNVDFEIEVKYDSRPSGTHAMQGIIVEGDSQNFLRYDFYSTGDSLNVFAATFSSGSPTVRVNQDVSGDQPMYLRVRRQGNQWTLRYSFNGSDWTTATVFSHGMSVSKVGFFVANAGGDPPAHTGSIDYFVDTANPGEPPPSAPEVTWVAPDEGAQLSGSVQLSVNASQNTDRVEFSAHGIGPIGVDSDGPNAQGQWTITWDTTAVSNGSYVLVAEAFEAGASTPLAAQSRNVSVSNDSPPPEPEPPEIESDYFNSTTLNTDVWQYIDPLGDSNLTLTGSHAQIGVPAGSAHDVWTGGNQAPRLMQAANNVDFEIEVKYDSRPSGTHAMQGIIVEGDSQNFLRYDFYSTGDSLNVFAATFSSGSPTVRVNQDVSGDQPMYLRVRREGNQWTLRYSFNGSDWTPVAIFNQSLSVTKVGFFVANAGGNPPAYTGSIDHFIDVDNPEEPGGNPDPDPSPTPTPEPEPDPPSGEVAWVTPAQNAEVSGAIELRVTAPEETVRVEFSAGGVGPLGTDQDGPDSNSEWLVSWDTTLVSNGSYDLLAQAFKVGATSPAAEKQIAVTVANPEAPDNGRVTSGLLALYDFGAGSGNTVHDVSGVGDPLDLHIENTSAASWGEGTLTLSGSNRVSSSGPATKIIDAATASNQVTLEAWITPATASQSGPARVATISDGSLHRNLMLGQGQPNGGNGARYEARLRSTNTNANGVPSVTSANNTAKASLQHVVYTRGTDGVGRLYIDGVEVASASIGGNLSNWDVNYRLALGNEFGIDRAWRGTYHLVAIFDRALSAEEVQKNFGAGPNG